MAVVFRVLQRCHLCAYERPSCALLRREISLAVARIEEEAEKAHQPTPEGEVVWDCLSFAALRRTRRNG